MTVLVTGGAGYIGSHMVHALVDQGERVVVLDNLSTGFRRALPEHVLVIRGCVGDETLLDVIMKKYDVSDIVHFAASIVVPESISDPLGYYRNNTVKTHALISSAVKNGVKRFVFSSTAAVYGMSEDNPITEASPVAPISPYGLSKYMSECILRDTSVAHDFSYVALRYFNVAGADPAGRTGQSTPRATHLIKVACQAALGQRDHLALYGDDYDTPDGTCVRDYIHVSDLISAHVLALDYLRMGQQPSRVMNCGYGQGYSVKEVIEAVQRVSEVTFDVKMAPRRDGDPAALVADSSLLRQTLNWSPEYADLDTIVRHALHWEKKLLRSPWGVGS